MDYEFIDSNADIEFIAYGDSLPKLFENSAKALCACVTNPDAVSQSRQVSVFIMASNPEEAMYKWLNEIIYHMETKHMVFSGFTVTASNDKTVANTTKGLQLITTDNMNCTVTGVLLGEHIKHHKIIAQVKAATMHDMEIHEEKGKWNARIILDT